MNRRDFLKGLSKFGLAIPFLPTLRLPDEDELDDLRLNALYPDAEEFKVETVTFVSFDNDGYTFNWSDAPKCAVKKGL